MRTPRDWWWAIRHRFDPRHRYHTVRTGLPPGYYDPCVRLTWAIFSEAERFIDGSEIVDWESDSGHAAARKVMTEAVAWWKKNRPPVAEGEWNTYTTEGEKSHEEAVEHMRAIIGVLGYMWYP